MKSAVPKIMKDSQRVRLCVYESVLRMARLNKYGVGIKLNQAAEAVVMAIHDMWREREPELKLAFCLTMIRRIDSLTFDLQLAKDLGAFRSFREFEAIIRIVEEVGAQSGGFRKRMGNKGQNAAAANPPQQRALTLSARTAPHAGVNP
jgi:hypothetical protein